MILSSSGIIVFGELLKQLQDQACGTVQMRISASFMTRIHCTNLSDLNFKYNLAHREIKNHLDGKNGQFDLEFHCTYLNLVDLVHHVLESMAESYQTCGWKACIVSESRTSPSQLILILTGTAQNNGIVKTASKHFCYGCKLKLGVYMVS